MEESKAAKLLRKWRSKQGITQRQASILCDVGETRYSEYERGYKKPTLAASVSIESATGIAPRLWLTPANARTRSARG